MLARVTSRSWALLLLLASVWGASYMLIKIGIEDDLPAAAIVFGWTALAALVLLPLAAALGALDGVRGRLVPVAVVAAIQVAGPFMLITLGEREISSSLAGILVASTPIFAYLLAFAVAHEERAGALALVGVAIGIAGVAVLLGADLGGSGAALAGGLMVVLASLGYAAGSHYLKRRFAGVQPVGTVAATMVASALMTLPLALAERPPHAPGLGALAAVAALGVVGTGFAFVVFYSLIESVGAAHLARHVRRAWVRRRLRRRTARRGVHGRHRGRARADRGRLLARRRGRAAAWTLSPGRAAAAALSRARRAGRRRRRCRARA
jgi:drug/metabolite transporter (DMT)-like permease